jgi:hypothetical protein
VVPSADDNAHAGTAVFTRVTTGDIVSDGRMTFGHGWGDYDGHGDPDLLACNLALGRANYLYRHDGGGVFTRGMGSILENNRPTTSPTWGDYDNDGGASGGTMIEFELPVRGAVSLIIYDVAGREVRQLVDWTLPEGRNTVHWDGHASTDRPAAPDRYSPGGATDPRTRFDGAAPRATRPARSRT